MAPRLVKDAIREACIVTYLTVEIVLVTLFFVSIQSGNPVVLGLCIIHSCSIPLALWSAVSIFSNRRASDGTDKTVQTVSFFITSVNTVAYGFYLARVPSAAALPTPSALAKSEAAYAVLGLSIGCWFLTFFLLISSWTANPNTLVEQPKPKQQQQTRSTPFTTFGRRKKDWLKKPLPVKILKVVHNPDLSMFEKHAQPARPWSALPEIEAGEPLYPEKVFDESDRWVDLPLH